MLATCLAVLASCGSPFAQTLPAPVQKSMQEARKSCKPEKAVFGKNFVARKDVNGDGVPDYVLDYEHFECGGSSSYYCGTGGCLTQVFASNDGGYVKVLDENVQGLEFKTLKGRPAMQIGLHGSSCGRPGMDPCGATLYWNGAKFSPAN